MLRTTPIRQFTNDFAKRWTRDDYFDLVIWYDPPDTIYGFQLSYDLDGHHRSLKWTHSSGYTHAKVDEDDNWYSSSPIMTCGAEFPFEKVHGEFLHRSAQFDPELRDLIISHIMTFGLKQRAR